MTRKLALIAIAVLFASPAGASAADDAKQNDAIKAPQEQLNEHELRLLKLMRDTRDAAEKRLEEKLLNIRRGRGPGFGNAGDARSIGRLLRAIKREDYVVPYLDPSDMKTDQLGFLMGGASTDPKESGHVFIARQVIDEQTMLVEPFGHFAHPVTLDVYFLKKDPVLIVGVSTKDLTDGKTVHLPQLFECLGTETYPTVIGGSNTVFAVKPYQISDYEQLNKTLEKAKELGN